MFLKVQGKHYEQDIFINGRSMTLNGYVTVPEGHPLHGVDHANVPEGLADGVVGGLTYSGDAEDFLGRTGWAFGFDCADDIRYVLRSLENLEASLFRLQL